MSWCSDLRAVRRHDDRLGVSQSGEVRSRVVLFAVVPQVRRRTATAWSWLREPPSSVNLPWHVRDLGGGLVSDLDEGLVAQRAEPVVAAPGELAGNADRGPLAVKAFRDAGPVLVIG